MESVEEQPDISVVLPKFKQGEADEILAEYQQNCGQYLSEPLVSSAQGKPPSSLPTIHPSRQQLYRESNLKPRASAYFRVQDLTLDEIVLVLMHPDSVGLFDCKSLRAIASLNHAYHTLSKEMNRLRNLDFSSLRQPRLDYASQTEISEERIDMTSACFMHYKGDTGLLVRYLGHEYTGLHRDPEYTLSQIEGHVDEEDYLAIKRMLSEGCPFEFDYEILKSDKMSMLKRGNQKSLDSNMDLVVETMNKEERHSHVIVMRSCFSYFGPSCWFIPQGMNLRKGKRRLISDGSTKLSPHEVVLNDITTIQNEPKITFGHTKMKVCKFIYNTRVTFPNLDILGGYVDVKACFRYIRIAPELAGAFGYIMESLGHYYFSNAGVFGWKGSCNVWEPFRRAIENMTAVIYERLDDDTTLHQDLIDQITWTDQMVTGEFTPAIADALNTGIHDSDGQIKRIPSFMFVDDAALIAIRKHMRRLLAAVIEAIFIVMGRRDDARRQCHLALDKWIGLHISPKFTYIGLEFDTRRLTIGIPDEYRDELIQLIDQPWHQGKSTFNASEITALTGKIARIGEACKWIYHLLPHLYASIEYALASNKKHYNKFSPSFRQMLQALKTTKNKDLAEANFAMRSVARKVHHSPKRYFINETLRDEIAAIREIIDPASGVSLESAIAHMIKREAKANAKSDSCLYGGGGFCRYYRVWWHVTWAKEIFLRTIKFTKGKDLITINDLEFMAMIINFAAALVAIEQDGIGEDPHPVILLWADNQSAVSWITKMCLKSMAGRALGRLFCFLLIDSPLGVNAKWIAGLENTIADVISRLKESTLDSDGHSNFDFSCLKQTFPQLQDCRQFLPSSELLSCLQRCVLTKKSPTLKELRHLKRQGLGKLTS